MSAETLAIVAVVIIIILILCAVSFIRSYMGRPVRNVLHVPQGKERVKVIVCDDSSLRPFKYGQVLDVQVLSGEHTMQDPSSGTPRRVVGVLAYKKTPVGFIDPASAYPRALSVLADKHKKTLVGMSVISIDEHGEPVAEVRLPNLSWFKRAWKAAR